MNARPKVIFAAERTIPDVTPGGITFSKLNTNLGNGMDKNSGIFTTPVGGVYLFHFSALAKNKSKMIHIKVNKNGVLQFYIHYNLANNSAANNIVSYSWSMVLSKDDTMNLHLNDNGLYASKNNLHVFLTGQLLKATE